MPLPEFLEPLNESGLGDEYLNANILQEAKDLPSLAKQLVDYNRMAGEQIRVPGKEATDEDWSGFVEKLNKKGVLSADPVKKASLKALGVPDSKDDYKLKPEEMPEGVQWDEDRASKWAEKFHELGVPASAAAEIMSFYTEGMADQGKETVLNAEQRERDIKAEFGPALDSELAKIMNVANQFGGEEMVGAMKTADVAMLRMMSKIAKQFDVSGDGEFTSQGERKMLSPTEAQARLDEVNKKLMDASLPRAEKTRLQDEAVRYQYMMLGERPKPTMATSG